MEASSVIIYMLGFSDLTVLYINIVSASSILEVVSTSLIFDKITRAIAF